MQTVITFSWDCDLKITRPLRWISTWLFRSFLGELMSTSYFGIVTSSKPYSRHLVAMWCAKSLLRFEPARCGSLEKYLWRTNKSSRSVFDNGVDLLPENRNFWKGLLGFLTLTFLLNFLPWTNPRVALDKDASDANFSVQSDLFSFQSLDGWSNNSNSGSSQHRKR